MQRIGAAAVIIGNEVLSAKVVEQNGALLIRRLRERGIPLRSVAIVPDDIDAIVEAVSAAHRRAEHVFTSGGIGPTHDDVTVRAVALALGRDVVRLPDMVSLIRQHSGGDTTDEALRLADAPAGSTLLAQEGNWYPVLSCDRIFLLPGVPQLFKMQLETVLATLPGAPVHLRALYLGVGESEVARTLDRIALAMPHVAIGSYPTFDRDAGYQVKLTVESDSMEPVAEAVGRLKAELPVGAVLREE